MAKKTSSKDPIDVKSLSNEILSLFAEIQEDLAHNIHAKYNLTGAQRVRVKSIRLASLFKLYRSVSIDYAKSLAKKPVKRKAPSVVKKKAVAKKKAK